MEKKFSGKIFFPGKFLENLCCVWWCFYILLFSFLFPIPKCIEFLSINNNNNNSKKLKNPHNFFVRKKNKESTEAILFKERNRRNRFPYTWMHRSCCCCHLVFGGIHCKSKRNPCIDERMMTFFSLIVNSYFLFSLFSGWIFWSIIIWGLLLTITTNQMKKNRGERKKFSFRFSFFVCC